VVTSCNVSEAEFYAVFDGVAECLSAAYEQGVGRVTRLITDAAKCADGWHERIRAALLALLVFFDEEPDWTQLLLAEPAPASRSQLQPLQQQALEALTRALVTETQSERNNSGWFVPWPELTAELVIGGVASVLRKRIRDRAREPFVELAPSLMAFILVQYPGANANVTTAPTPARHDAQSQLQRLPVRVTYRTTCVLNAIGDCPGLSNRDIAEAAGLTDEGQTSRLLRRLEARSLVQNVGVGHAYGGANAWLLTAYGQRVLDATRHSLAPGAGAVTRRRVRGAA
jgi:AcrR family transcriptional regulator